MNPKDRNKMKIEQQEINEEDLKDGLMAQGDAFIKLIGITEFLVQILTDASAPKEIKSFAMANESTLREMALYHIEKSSHIGRLIYEYRKDYEKISPDFALLLRVNGDVLQEAHTTLMKESHGN